MNDLTPPKRAVSRTPPIRRAGLVTWAGLLLLAACTVPKRGPATAPPADVNVFAEVRDHTGAAVTRGALLGHWSVLWFYPKAQTSG